MAEAFVKHIKKMAAASPDAHQRRQQQAAVRTGHREASCSQEAVLQEKHESQLYLTYGKQSLKRSRNAEVVQVDGLSWEAVADRIHYFRVLDLAGQVTPIPECL